MVATLPRILTSLAALCLYAGGLHAQHAHHAPAPDGDAPTMRGRDASGTSWQPDAAPHEGTHVEWRGWRMMFHGAAQLAATHQGGPRGDDDVYLNNMFMTRAARGDLTLSGMFSLEPATIGKRGYPLLLQTGETADGVSHLIDAQHPHDFLMELSANYRRELANGDAAYV